MLKRIIPVFLLIAVAVLSANFISFSSKKTDYNAEVKPLLNKHCIACHGGVRRKSGFSLLTKEDALKPAESGKSPIVPGKPEESEIMRRLRHHDPEERMPYQEEPLKSDEIETLRRWIKEGANFDRHWAFRSVEKTEVPKPGGWFFGLFPAKKPAWVQNDLDYFILDKIKKEDLRPSAEADKATLLRRVSLDLTGLPAPESLAQKFLSDTRPEAYETLVDSLLALPAYGERWTALWLDLARYADTKGYEADGRREIWRYRDWLIRAFNEDKPYDQFLTEQLAGDYLAKNAAPEKFDNLLIASAFHRNTMTNDEGGTDSEEYRTAAIIDRVNTTWEALMGTTFACVQCHDHPYDPFRHDEYYQFMAYFNDTRDADTGEDYPLLRHFAPEDSLKLLALKGWADQAASPEKAAEIFLFLKTLAPAKYSLETDHLTKAFHYSSRWLGLQHNGSARMPGVNLDGKRRLIFNYEGYFDGGKWSVHLDKPDGKVLFSTVLKKTKGWKIEKIDFPPVEGTHDLWFRYSNPGIKNPEMGGNQFDWFFFTEPLPGEESPAKFAGKKDAQMRSEFWRLLQAETKTTPILLQNPPGMRRPTYVFERGNWLVKGKEVQEATPGHLPPLPAGASNDRLGMAAWMTSPDHPLTARTMVNRLWEQLFGYGLAETVEDLGSQGIPPTHRELLDWLSWNFMHDYDWSLKRLLKTMVMSATYRQDSKATPELLEKDPLNKFLARSPRVRLSAEQVRDQALAIAGVLSKKMYGPSVMPDQPGGIWKSPWNGDDWKMSEGEDRFRRGVYTFWKRTAPYPAMMTFDGATREVCTARRVRTNTPLQALVTLNDEAFLEAARYFAERMQTAGGGEEAKASDWISTGYQIALGKKPAPEKLAALEKLYNQALEGYKKQPEQAKLMVGKDANAETAALVVTANAILNLDEILTK